MKDENLYTENALNAAHQVRNTAHELDEIIYGMKALGIPAGDNLQDIRNHLITLSEECANHVMKEQHEQLLETQGQTWGLVGAVFADAASKLR